MEHFYQEFLTAARTNTRWRELIQSSYSNNIDFSTNDYLCLSRNPVLLQAAKDAIKTKGVGSGGSRVVCGNSREIQQLEAHIASCKNMEKALVFPSGYQTNISVLQALLDERVLKSKPIVFFDKQNHASLYNGVFLANAQMVRYPHANLHQLELLLEKFYHDKRPRFIVSETVFGMDGDVINLERLVELAETYHAFLYLDEAHATGLFGPRGYGLSTTVDLSQIPCAVMGTFSKALGAQGGYVACSKITQAYLINKAPGFIYATAPSPLLIDIMRASWDLIPKLDKERDDLLSRASFVRTKLQEKGINTLKSTTHIIPIILKDELKALNLQKTLASMGYRVSCIRPPTVPPNTSRLRICLNVSHTHEQLERFMDTLEGIIHAI